MESTALITEQELQSEISTVEATVNGMTVIDEATYSAAAMFARNIKTAAARVAGFFEPMKSGAYNAWKAICNKENEFKKPLDAAEKTIKAKMGTYQAEQDRIRREKEAELLRQQREEAERREKEAYELAQQGKAQEAAKAFAEAVKIDEQKVVIEAAPKAAGVTYRTEYQVTVTDEKTVPAYVGGVCIRPVDTAMLKKLATTAKGKLDIPGVQIIEARVPVIRGF